MRRAARQPPPPPPPACARCSPGLCSSACERLPGLRAVLAVHRAALGDAHRTTLNDMDNLAAALAGLGRGDDLLEAEALLRAALAGRARVLGAAHAGTLTTLRSLQGVLNCQGRAREARALRDAFAAAAGGGGGGGGGSPQ